MTSPLSKNMGENVAERGVVCSEEKIEEERQATRRDLSDQTHRSGQCIEGKEERAMKVAEQKWEEVNEKETERRGAHEKKEEKDEEVEVIACSPGSQEEEMVGLNKSSKQMTPERRPKKQVKVTKTVEVSVLTGWLL